MTYSNRRILNNHFMDIGLLSHSYVVAIDGKKSLLLCESARNVFKCRRTGCQHPLELVPKMPHKKHSQDL